jgi:hypothetical protein
MSEALFFFRFYVRNNMHQQQEQLRMHENANQYSSPQTKEDS